MDNKCKHLLRKASFQKILQEGFFNKLPVPQAFTNIFDGEIPPWFILEIAGTRKCWKVDTEQDENGTLYLGYGFDSFVKEHFLEIGNFLLFKLKNPSILKVKIYEKDGSERTQEMKFKSEFEVGEASESRTEVPIYHQEGNASPCPKSDSLTSVQKRAKKKQRGCAGNGGSARKNLFVSDTEDVCFSVTWRPVLHHLYYMTIPRDMLYGKTYSNEERITVQDGEGNSWLVELRLTGDCRVDLARGWKDFVYDNKLTSGDTLTFRFVSDKVIRVHVQRASQVNDLSQREHKWINQPSEHKHSTSEHEQLAGVYTSSGKAPRTRGEFRRLASEMRSSFSLTWTHKTSLSDLHIPKPIANTQKLENNDIVILCDPKGKRWLMEIKTRPDDGRVRIQGGWCDFTRAYDFGVGDTLTFEFVTDRMIKVNVVKASELEHTVSEATIKQEVFDLH